MFTRTKLRWIIVFISCLLVIFLARELPTASYIFGIRKDKTEGYNKFDDHSKNQSICKLQIREKHYLDYLSSLKELNQAKERRLPDVINIGAEKCGTGFLRKIMKEHPKLKFPCEAEPHFFSLDWSLGVRAYRRLMPRTTKQDMVMEKSPSYFHRFYIPRRMKSVLPNIKLIAILCDPVNRTISDYVQETAMGNIPENSTFDSYIPKMIDATSRIKAYQDYDERVIEEIDKFFSKGASHLLSVALYYYHLTRWFRYYGRSQFFIIDGADLITDPGKVVEDLQDFLGIPKLIISEDFVKDDRGFYCFRPPQVIDENGEKRIVSDKMACSDEGVKGRTRLGRWEYKPSADTINNLKDFFRSFNEKLFKLLGRRFKWQ